MVATETTQEQGTRERLIDAAMELFYAQGYEGTGVKEVLKKAGANSGSLYYFFPKKEDLLVAVLEKYKVLLYPMVLQPVFEQVSDPIERIFGVLNGYRMGLEMTQCTSACPIGNLALEMCEKSEAARKGIAENFEGWRLAIRQCLIDAGDRLPPDVDRDQLATLILSVMEGGVMQAKAYRSLARFDAGLAMLRDYINRLCAMASGSVRRTESNSGRRKAVKQGNEHEAD